MEILSEVFNYSPVGIFVSTLDGIYVDLNKKVIELCGYSKEELLNMSVRDLIHNEDKEYANEQIDKVIKDGYSNFDVRFIKKNNEEGWWNINAVISNNYLIGYITDISNDKNYISNILNNSELYKSLIKNSFDGFWVVDINGCIRETNNTYNEKLGYFKDELIGQKISLVEALENEEETLEKINKIKDLKFVHFQTKHIAKDKTLHDVEVKVQYDDLNRLFYVFIKDITDELFILNELKSLQKLISLTLENAVAGFWFYDTKEKKLHWDKGLYKIFEIDEDATVSNEKFLSLIHPLDKKRVEEKINKTKIDGTEYSDIYRIITDKGNLKYIFSTAYILRDEDGNVLKYSGLNFDRTDEYKNNLDLKDLNQRFKIAVESGNIGVWDFDYQNNILEWNEPMFEIYEVEKNEFNHTIQAWEKIVHPEDLAKTNENLYNAIRFDGLYNTIFRINTKSGKLKYIDAYGKIIKDNDGNHIKISGVNIDITNSVNEQLELKKAKELAEENDKLKTAFLHNISHEIRTPLNGIIGFTHFLTEDIISQEEKIEFEKLIKNSANRLIQVIDDIIDLSMIETGQIELKKQLFDLNGVVDDVYVLYKDRMKEKGLDFKYSYDASQSVQLFSDSKYILKILSHLLHNALKFTNSGVVELSYKLNGKKVQFKVKDSGIGIEDTIKNKIYERFVQGDNEVNRNYEGAGIGLTLCKELVEKLGGEIWFESQYNVGSTFYFELPLRENDENYILIAEDNDTSFTFLKILLKKSGYNIIRALNGKEAVEMCESHNIDLILMDMKMPIMSGYEATEIIRRTYKNLPVIAVTADAVEPLVDKALKAGCNSHLAKPIEPKILLTEIKKYLN